MKILLIRKEFKNLRKVNKDYLRMYTIAKTKQWKTNLKVEQWKEDIANHLKGKPLKILNGIFLGGKFSIHSDQMAP